MITFEIKAIVSNNDDLNSDHTIYLFNKEQKLLLPVKVPPSSVNDLIAAKETTKEPRPHVHNTTKRIINALNGKVDRIIISGYQNEIFYTYIRLKQHNKIFDIDSKPTDAFAIALRTGAPIFAEEHVIDKTAVKITPEMLTN